MIVAEVCWVVGGTRGNGKENSYQETQIEQHNLVTSVAQSCRMDAQLKSLLSKLRDGLEYLRHS